MCHDYIVTVTMDTGECFIYVVEFPSSEIAIKEAIKKAIYEAKVVKGILGDIARIDVIRADGKIL